MRSLPGCVRRDAAEVVGVVHRLHDGERQRVVLGVVRGELGARAW